MSSRGSRELGYTEMKGSWFIFDTYRAHEDWCRWRAPFWHGTRVMDEHSHANYHLGFRCCSCCVSGAPRWCRSLHRTDCFSQDVSPWVHWDIR